MRLLFFSCVLSFCTLIFCFRHSSSLEKGTERKRKIGTLESPFRERIEKSRWPSPRTTRRTTSRTRTTVTVRVAPAPARRAAWIPAKRAVFTPSRNTHGERHFSRERPTTAWCLRLLRRERPRIRREVFGNAMMHSIASRRRAAWLASQPGPAASSRIGFSRL